MPMRTATRWIERWALACALAAPAGCVEATPLPPEPPPLSPSAPPAVFALETTDGGTLTASSLHGRFTVIALVATYDVVSQAQLRILGRVLRTHEPRVNGAAIVVGPQENRPIAIAYGQSLGARFPVAMAGPGVLDESGPFGGLVAVPSLVFLDLDGRVVARHTGLLEDRPLHAELQRLGARR